MSYIKLILQRAIQCPKKDWDGSESDVFVVIQAVARKGHVLHEVKSRTIQDRRDPDWNTEHVLPLQTATIKFTLYDDGFPKEYIGEAEISMPDFVATPEAQLLVHDRDGNPVVGSEEPHWPCVLFVKLDLKASTLPEGVRPCGPGVVKEDEEEEEKETSHESEKEKPKERERERHALLLTRGTRGDVQPFVALARGLARQKGWRVTICTELRWKGFVLQNAHGVSPGRICYLDSGGDTERKVESALGQWATAHKSEFLQLMMLARSEAEFFNSSTTVMWHVRELRKTCPVDMLIYGLTLTGVALMAGDYYDLPAVGFNLQPSSLHSDDGEWAAVHAIDTTWFKAIDYIEEKLFTSQRALGLWKALNEKNPLAQFNIRSMRRWFNLPAADDTRAMMRERRRPVVIPMRPNTFTRPSDWWDEIVTTDFIFLRSGGAGSSDLGEPLKGFIERAKQEGAKLGVMTFSSMPVPRKTMLACATKMVTECKFNLRLIYVGKRRDQDAVPARLAADAEALEKEGRFLDVERADFGVLFPHMDVFIVHGGLGTTVEALRMQKPATVTGPLLMDQRFWGNVCFKKGVGMEPVHIDDFVGRCLQFVDGALDPKDPEGWQAAALAESWGDVTDDGVKANVDHFDRLLQAGSGASGQDGATLERPGKRLKLPESA